MQKLLETREDVQLMVDTFYGKVRVDELIGPKFAHVHWDEHLPKLYNFWADLLLGEDTYRGRPFPPHLTMGLEQVHFERWLVHFINTVDEHFHGLKAEEAKNRALRIARNFMINLQILKQP